MPGISYPRKYRPDTKLPAVNPEPPPIADPYSTAPIINTRPPLRRKFVFLLVIVAILAVIAGISLEMLTPGPNIDYIHAPPDSR